MRNLNNKSGFTLIEIIVVMIIVGILAAVALPNLFNNVAKGQATAALGSLDGDKTSEESCLAQHFGTVPGTSPCDTTTLQIPTVLNSGWTAGIATAAVSLQSVVPTAGTATSGPTYTLEAKDAAATPGFISLTRNTDGSFLCQSSTNYSGTCPS